VAYATFFVAYKLVSLAQTRSKEVKYRNAIFIVLAVIIFDQLVKVYIKTHFYYGEEVNVLGSWFRLHFIENEGMAFGMKLGDADMGKLVLTLFRLVAVSFGFYLLKRIINKGYSRGAIICGALILAGALGNLIDSIFYGMIFNESTFHIAKSVPFGEGYGKLFHGRVVDMLYFPLVDTHWPAWVPGLGGRELVFFEPVFNIADAAISIGVLTLVFFQKKLMQKNVQPVQQTNSDANAWQKS
jgi:signal peptidase II